MQSERVGTRIRYLFSFDDKVTWHAYKNDVWTEIIDLSDANVLVEGMTKEEVESIVLDLETSVNINIRCVLMTSVPTETALLKKIDILY